jgi:hypothetical protein
MRQLLEVTMGLLQHDDRTYTTELFDVLPGLACRDRWDETTGDRLRDDRPIRALRRYEELMRMAGRRYSRYNPLLRMLEALHERPMWTSV